MHAIFVHADGPISRRRSNDMHGGDSHDMDRVV